MELKDLISFLILFNIARSELPSNITSRRKVFDGDLEDNGKSSLVFVFDTTGSMYNDLRQLREGAEMILKTALEESDVIEDFVFVPFHDPAVGPATVTKDKEVFKSALNIVRVYGGGDCPEKSLGGIQLALNVSRPRSFVYVFTDATASDHRLVAQVLDGVQRKQTQVVFVLTGHCNDLHRPHYQVYQQIAAASAGQLFNLNKTSVHKVLDFVKSSIRGRMVNLGSAVNPAGYNYTQSIPIDSSLGEVTVSVSGDKPSIRVVNPSGEELTGPPKLITTLDLNEIMVVKVLQPEPGNWSITTGSADDYSVKVVGLSNLTFNHGFSVELPTSMAETSYRPLQGTYNHLLIALTEKKLPVEINYAEILSLNGRTLFEIPLKVFDHKEHIYLADAFMPPDDFFYIAINGRDANKQELRRIGSTAVQAKAPDVPYLVVPRKVEARSHDTVVLRCSVESLVPVTAMWTKDTLRIQPQISSLQSTSVEYVIEDMSEGDVGTYRCVAKNVAGFSRLATEVTLIVDPPQVTVFPVNRTAEIGENITISCAVVSDALLLKFQLVFNSTENSYVLDVHTEPNIEGRYVFNKTIYNVSERDNGIYTCVASNRGGSTNATTHLTIQTDPLSQILGPHTITKHIYTDVQIVCNVDNANELVWLDSNGSVVKSSKVNGTLNDMLELKNISGDGFWSCVAVKGGRNASDSVEITVLIKPQVEIAGSKNITVLNGTSVDITCKVVAKPEPRIIWHRETERFLNNTITILEENVYKSVLTLDSSKEDVNGTYFCFGENSEGIHQDSVTVSVRSKMTLIEGFSDTTTELYSQIHLSCQISSYPAPTIIWYHNNTELAVTDNIYLSENNNTLFIMKVDFDDLGAYMCEADNGYESLKVIGSLAVIGLESPVINKGQQEIVTQKGKSTIIPCRLSKGSPQPVISWQYKSDSLQYNTLPDGIIMKPDHTELIILNAMEGHHGTYKCTAENVLGSDTFEVSLVIQYPPQMVQDTNSDDNLTQVQAGRKISFSCKAKGVPPPVVFWRKNSMPISYSRNVYLTDSSELVIENATEYDSGLFTCNVTSALGTLQKNFTLYVFVPLTIAAPGIEPELEVLEGDLVELPCNVQGAPRPYVQWFQNGEPMNDERKRVDAFGLSFIANLTDFGEYTCLASNEFGNRSLTYSVYIWVPPSIGPPLEVSTSLLVGENISLNCNAVGFPIPNIVWEFQDEILVENTTDLSFNEYGDIYIRNGSSVHEGLYTCIAENVAGLAKKTFFLKVNEPPKIINDNFTGPFVATNRDTEVVISCRVSGKPTPFVVWTKDGRFLDKDSHYEMNAEGTLTIKNPSEDMSGQYTCVAKNTFGTANRTFQVEIYPILPSRLQADEAHSSITVLEGTNATIECPIHASNADRVKWYKDAILLSTGNLTIPNITRNNSTSYACVVSNSIGSTYSIVHVNVEWRPLFVQNVDDNNVHENRVAVKGEDVYFGCESDANPSAETKWLFNSKRLLGEDKPQLKLLNVQLRNSGVYKCVVTNEHGTISRQFTFDVLEPPFISDFDLLDVQLKEGINAALECNAKGSPKPTVKWSYNNTNWFIQNSSLATLNASVDSEGLYRCDATNDAGATFIVYRVTVTAPARVQDVVVFREGSAGESVAKTVEVTLNTHIRLSCSASGKPLPMIQWLKNGNVLSQNTEDIGYADLVLEEVKTSQNGVYLCVASNDGGVDERRIKVDVLEPPKIFKDLFQAEIYSKDSVLDTRLEVILGQAFYLHCHPYGNPLPEIYWFKDGLPLRLFDDSMVSKDYGEVLVSKAAKLEQSGNYTCVARNKVGDTSVVYLVDVLVPPPTPKESTHNISTRVGKQLSLTCPVEGSPTPNVMWVKHPYVEISADTRVMLVDDNVTLIINQTEITDSGKYTCVMTNKVGSTEVTLDVTIEKSPSIAGNVGNNIVESHIVPLRRSVVLKCQADGNPTPKISWLKDTQQLSENLSNIQRVLGNSLLAVWSASTRDAGQYICIAENGAGTAYRRYNVRVQVPGKWNSWSQWSLCNVTCGLGYQRRSRLCHYVDDFNVTYDKTNEKIIIDDSSCKGMANDRRKCHMPPCEEDGLQSRWSPWSKWSPCAATCGAATQARTRRCRGRSCSGDNVQIRRCPGLPQCGDYSERGNDVFSGEVVSSEEMNAYIPEATFEMQPEVVKTQYATDTEEHLQPEPKYSVIYYEANVTDNLDRSYQGKCESGFKQNNVTGTCDDIDECLIENNLCHSTQICENTIGAYRCSCPKGFVSLGIGQRCLDINECEQEIHGCEFACVNTAGGYVCACPAHRRLHADRHRCVAPAFNKRRHSYEELESDEYLSATLDFPSRYVKNRT